MRAVSSEFDSSPTDSFVGVLDQFAALRSYSSDGVGGYRVLARKRPEKHTAARRLASTAAETLSAMSRSLSALPRARVHLTGSLSVLFMCGLGLAVLAGPANCPCTADAQMAETSSMMRLGYVENAHFVSTHDDIAASAELPTSTVAALVEPSENVTGESPITTSALVPAAEVVTAKREGLSTLSAGKLPARIEPLADAGPTVRVAAMTSDEGDIESDLAPALPVILARTPPAKIVAQADNDDAPRVKRKKNLRAYRTPVAKSAKQHAARNGEDQFAVKRAPKWAQQMYVTPWQTQAFSYQR